MSLFKIVGGNESGWDLLLTKQHDVGILAREHLAQWHQFSTIKCVKNFMCQKSENRGTIKAPRQYSEISLPLLDLK